MKFIRIAVLFVFAAALMSCKKSNGDGPVNTNQPPANLTLNATLSMDNTGTVAFVATATNAVSFEYDFGNGTFQTSVSGSITYKYPSSGVYTVKVTAKSAGGQTVSMSANVQVTVTSGATWADEFDGNGAPDPTKWGYDIGTGSNGWGNQEAQYYTNRTDNAVVSNGTLKINLKKETFSGSNYTSARLVSNNKFFMKYGRVEIRAKLPAGGGVWPALWMLGANFATNPWPGCGEIDIMEYKGNEPNKIYGTFHYPGRFGGSADGSSTMIQNATTEFHIYGLQWDASSIKISVDGTVFKTLTNSSSLPFNSNFFFIMNVAMGGTFGGAIDPAVTGGTMEVDYIRVFAN